MTHESIPPLYLSLSDPKASSIRLRSAAGIDGFGTELISAWESASGAANDSSKLKDSVRVATVNQRCRIVPIPAAKDRSSVLIDSGERPGAGAIGVGDPVTFSQGQKTKGISVPMLDIVDTSFKKSPFSPVRSA
jgi:hypothetical protein